MGEPENQGTSFDIAMRCMESISGCFSISMYSLIRCSTI